MLNFKFTNSLSKQLSIEQKNLQIVTFQNLSPVTHGPFLFITFSGHMVVFTPKLSPSKIDE